MAWEWACKRNADTPVRSSSYISKFKPHACTDCSSFDVKTKGFARERSLGASQVTAVGAFSRATVGWFDRERKDYRHIAVDEQCDVLSLLGDIAVADEGPTPHLHAVLGLADGTTRDGLTCWGAGCGRRWRSSYGTARQS